MQTIRLTLVLIVFAWSHVAAADEPIKVVAKNRQSPVLKIGEPVALFDGKTLNGWTTQDGNPVTRGWKVEDGTIYRESRGGNIFYEHEVSDFELKFEWKIVKGGNNGLKYRVRKYNGRTLGCEYQLLGETGRSLSKGSCGSLYALYEPNEKKKLNPIGEWNSAKIVVQGPKIEHWMNGAKIVEVDLASEEWRKRLSQSKFSKHKDFARNSIGRIMLTDHGSEVWYRDLILTPLPTKEIPPLASEPSSTDVAIFADAKPHLVLEKRAGEGPAWDPKLGLLFSGGGNIMRMSHDGQVEVFRKGAGTNGLLFDHQGNLLACEPKFRQVTRIDSKGTRTVLADRYDGKRFNQPNDITVDSKGRIYFSDPCYGNRSRMEMTDEQGKKVEGVYRIDPDGEVTRIITHEVDRPNGLVVTLDDRYLYVADNNNNNVGGARKLWRFGLKKDGSIDTASQKQIHDWKTSRGPDGMVLDQKGRLYVAGGLNKKNPPNETNENKGGVYVFSREGKLLTFVHIPRDEVTNCAFGGKDLKTLYITAGGTLWSIRATAPGQMPWPTNE